MKNFKKIASFIRWRLVPMRYLTLLKDMHLNRILKTAPARTSVSKVINEKGYCSAPSINKNLLADAIAIYQPRTLAIVPNSKGHPFVNLFTSDDINPDNPVFRLAFSPDIFDIATDYFGNKIILDSIQVLHSWTTNGEIRESQFWHLDYGDRKSFHAVAYLNDVLDSTDGPFVFVDKKATRKVGRSLIVRRIPDQQFAKELGDAKIHSFQGPAGAMVYVDPSVCYHYGSRCKQSRLAIFVTFSSWFPFVQPTNQIKENREKIYAAAKRVRPDLNPDLLKSMLQLT
jgi:hypothetical protein